MQGWLQVDPKAEAQYGYSPYASMNNNPISMSDPDGDLPFLAVVGIGAAVGVFGNGISNAQQGQGFFDGAGKAAFWGGVGAAASFGVGAAFGATGSFGHELGRGIAHGFSSGIQSELQGGSFGQGFLSGGISSGIGSALNGQGAGAQIFGGGVGGGIGSAISGGNFFDGFTQGVAVGAFNHALHSGLSGAGDPTKKQVKEWLAGEFLDGRISKQDYINAVVLVDDGSWALLKQVLYNNRGDIALSMVPVARPMKALSRVPKGELWVDLATGKHLKGGQFISKSASYLKFGNNSTRTFSSGTGTVIKTAPRNIWRTRLEALSRFLGIGT